MIQLRFRLAGKSVPLHFFCSNRPCLAGAGLDFKNRPYGDFVVEKRFKADYNR